MPQTTALHIVNNHVPLLQDVPKTSHGYPSNSHAVSVPTHCATIKVASVSDMNNQDGDQWYTLYHAVTILNSSSRVPLNCVVALQGDEQSPSHGIMVCFISLSLDLFTLLKENSKRNH